MASVFDRRKMTTQLKKPPHLVWWTRKVGDERARESPSDHVPVSVEIETNGDDDDRPMVF